MSSPSPSPPDISGLSISAQLERSNEGYDHAYFSTAPSPYTMLNTPSQPYDGPYNNTMAAVGAKPTRGGLPSHWIDQQSSANIPDNRSTSPPTDLSSSGSPPAQYLAPPNVLNPQPSNTPVNSEEEIIPTAIVIKNIPFSVKRETLLDIIASLSIPTPYAFNYHLDAAGAFRGLAFANFRLPADADAVVAALNGFDVQGRKLRVEYKKVLQAGEKERIEREKALRRMRSMQLEKEKERAANSVGGDWEDYGVVQSQQQYGSVLPPGLSGSLGAGPIGLGHPAGDGGLQASPARSFSAGPLTSHQYLSHPLPQVPPVPQIPQHYYSSQRQQSQTPQLHLTTPPPVLAGSVDNQQDPFSQAVRSFSPPSHASASPPLQTSTPSKSTTELDLNDPSTLEIYSRILVFKEDRMRDELAFSRSLSPKQRRVVHLVAQKLGVYHYSVGEGDERYAVVTRIERENRGTPARHPSHTLSRAQSSYLSPATASGSPTRSSPNSVLRAKKSMPDLTSLHTPPPRLNSRASNGNIREGYATISSPGRRSTPGFGGLFGSNSNGASSGGIPPVPTLPPMPNILVDPATTGVVRQPRGPGVGGFGVRRPSDITRFGVSASTGGSGNGSGNTPGGSNGGLDTRSHEPLEI